MEKIFLHTCLCISLLLITSCNANRGNSSAYTDADTVAVENDTATAVETVQTEETTKPQKVDFIQGGVTYFGHEVKENAGLDMNEHSESDYTIQCFKDGTMKWHEKHYYRSGYERKYEGEWKKKTDSRYDVEYTWYEFWGTTYDIHMNSSYDMIGFADEDGNLYTMFSTEDPMEAIANNKSICKLKAQ